jgi:hypothetical protein
MFIVASGGQAYARLRLGFGPGGEFVLPVEVDFGRPFPAAAHAAWEEEYLQNVTAEPELARTSGLVRPFDDPPPWTQNDGARSIDHWMDPYDLYPDAPLEICNAPF